MLGTFHHPEFNLGIALISTVIGLAGIGLAYAWYFRNLGPHGITERNKLARAGHTVLVEKYYFDHLYTGDHRRRREGPDRQGGLLVQPEGHRRRDQRRRHHRREERAGGSTTRSTRASSTPSSTARVAAAEGSGQGLRHIQTGRVQQYAALLFAGAAILAAIFIIVI